MQGQWKTYSSAEFREWLRTAGAALSYGVYTDTSQVFYIVPPHGNLQGEFEALADNLTAVNLLQMLDAVAYEGDIYRWEEPVPEPPPAESVQTASEPEQPVQPEPSIEELKAENAFLIRELDRVRREYNKLKEKADSIGLKL